MGLVINFYFLFLAFSVLNIEKFCIQILVYVFFLKKCGNVRSRLIWQQSARAGPTLSPWDRTPASLQSTTPLCSVSCPSPTCPCLTPLPPPSRCVWLQTLVYEALLLPQHHCCIISFRLRNNRMEQAIKNRQKKNFPNFFIIKSYSATYRK